MLRIRLPHSLLVAGFTSIIGMIVFVTEMYTTVFAMSFFIAAAVEIILAIVVVRALVSVNEFPYDSLVGQILRTYTISDEIGLPEIGHLAAARTVSYIIAAVLLLFDWYLWLYGPAMLYLLTIIHYLPENKSPN